MKPTVNKSEPRKKMDECGGTIQNEGTESKIDGRGTKVPKISIRGLVNSRPCFLER